MPRFLTGLAALIVAGMLTACGNAISTSSQELGTPTTTVTATPTARPGLPIPGNSGGTPGFGNGGPPGGTSILPRPSGTPGSGFPFNPPPPSGASGTGAVTANSDGSCPEAQPVKATRLGRTYHLKADPSYQHTRADECFATEQAAQDAGYRHVVR